MQLIIASWLLKCPEILLWWLGSLKYPFTILLPIVNSYRSSFNYGIMNDGRKRSPEAVPFWREFLHHSLGRLNQCRRWSCLSLLTWAMINKHKLTLALLWRPMMTQAMISRWSSWRSSCVLNSLHGPLRKEARRAYEAGHRLRQLSLSEGAAQ